VCEEVAGGGALFIAGDGGREVLQGRVDGVASPSIERARRGRHLVGVVLAMLED
jgi:hypothetical protein